MNLMTIFRRGAKPEEVSSVTTLSREAQLLDERRAIDAELDLVAARMKTFRRENTISVNAHGYFCGSNVSDRAALAREWDAYLHQVSVLIQKRNQVLAEWSSLKAPNVYA